MPTAAPLRPADPTSIGGYTLAGRLGAGGMGTVYLGRSATGEDVAIKVLHERLTASPPFLARFADEAAAARRVAGFCTARVLHADVTARPPYLVTEYVAGPTLDEALAAGGPLPASDVEALAVGVAAALTAIHAAGLAHRDLKPSNVLLSRLGPKVIDFGIARALDAPGDRTETGMLFGTPGWLAPEQLYGQSTQASDVFVWGLLIARAGTGWRPALELRVTVPSAADLAGLPASLATAVSAALNTDPALRPTARELLLRLCGSAEAGQVRTATRTLSRPWAAPYPTASAPAPNGYPQHQPPPAYPKYQPPTGYAQQRPPSYPSHKSYPSYAPYQPHQPIQPFRPQPRSPANRPWPVTPPAKPARRRRWYTRKRFILLALVLLVVVLINNADGRPPGQLPAGTARDGILEFTVTGWKCGQAALGTPPLQKQAQGQLCTIDLNVRNFGDQSRRVFVGSQKLRDTAGRTFDADSGAGVYLRRAQPFLTNDINPGNELAGTLVYDIAKDSQPEQLEVHDSPFSGGAPVQLP